MKKLLSFIALGIMIGAVSCAKQEINEGNGMGMLSVDVDLPGQTRAFSEDQLYATAKVNIYKADYSGLVRSYAYSAIPSPLYLAADNYRVDVLAGEAVAENPSIASWDNKSYKGSQSFEIVAKQVTTVQVVAGVNNAVTKVTFDPTVATNFSAGYTLTMTLSDEAASNLVYDASKDGAEGYFIVTDLFEPSFTWTFTGTLLKDGSSFTKSGVIENIQPGKLYTMNLKYTIKDGDLEFSLSVDRTTQIVDDTIVFEPVSTGLAPSSVYEIWAKRATIHADVDPSESEGKSVRFAYLADGGSTWNYVDGVNDSEGTWKADLTGLAPSTDYTYKLLIGDVEIGEPLTFTTEAAPMLPNGSFEHYSKVSGQDFYKFYDPDNCSDCCATKFWASGNGDEQTTGSIIPGTMAEITKISTDCVDGSVSILAESIDVMGIKFAAGNLFTGQFLKTEGTSGGSVNFGRPWTSRPTALKLYCKYTTGTIDCMDALPSDVNLTNSDYDRAQIKVALGTWDYKKYGGSKDSPVYVNTLKEDTFVDYYTDNSTIANGDIIIYNDGYDINRGGKVSSKTDEWVEYVIPIDYRNFNAYPTHIIISCASSQYGDYFTGSSSSKLWIDAVELIYE